MRCPSCGHQNRKDARYCDSCGAPLATGSGIAVSTEPQASAQAVTPPPPEATDVGAPAAPVTGTEPLYRTTFVGREAELHQLQAAFDGASSGDGSLFMVVGEPGIGKTTLCEQVAAYVRANCGTTLIGHCYEEGSLSLPYLAFVEAMRSYVLERDLDDLKEELGGGAADLARIVPELGGRLGVEPTPPSDPEQDRYRLLQAASTFLRSASNARPLLIVLEDLHDADSGTLDMLKHVARGLSGSRLLIVGTYRDVEVDRSHALSGALAELRRVSAFGRIALRGLTADEVQRMMAAIAGWEVPWSLSEAVYRQTEGNPLFVQEVLRDLVEEGHLSGEGSISDAAMSIPEGLRDVIGKRLTRLSQECNRVLSIAAVIGREFRLDVLQGVSEKSEEELFAALEEAQGAAVIEERLSTGAAVSFWFTHAFFRQTLYEEMFAPRRIRLHQQVGRALEGVHESRPEEHAAEMAEHFAHSSDTTGLQKALAYSEMAAGRSMAVYAYGEAARLLEQALQVQEVLAPDDRAKRCDLLLALGDALMPAGEPKRVYDTMLPEALALAEAIDDRVRLSHTCLMALEAANRYGGGLVWGTPEGRRWAERADEYAEPDTTDRVWADIFLGGVSYVEGNPTKTRAFSVRALELARRLDDPEALFATSTNLILFGSPPQYEEEWWCLVTEMEDRPHVGVKAQTLGQWLSWSAMVYLDWGERARAEAQLEELGQLAQRAGDTDLLLRSLWVQLISALLDGRLEEALTVTERLVASTDELGVPARGRGFVLTLGFRPLLYVGRAEEAIAAIGEVGGLPTRWHSMSVLARAHLGPSDEAEDSLRRLLTEHPFFLEGENVPTYSLVWLLETAVLIEDRELCSVLSQRLAPVSLYLNFGM